MSLYTTAAAVYFLFSSAHCWIAPSICRRLLIQEFICEVVRALTKLGIAIAAKRPIMATTIMISTRVKPALRDALIFILQFVTFCFLRGERNNRRVTIIALFVHTLPVVPVGRELAWSMPDLRCQRGEYHPWKQKGPKLVLRAR